MPGTIVPLPVMLEDEEDRRIYEKLQPPKSMVVRYGYQRLIAELDYDGDAKPGCGSKLVIRTPRGTEIGEMLTSTCPNSGCGKSVSRKEMLEYIENSGGKDYPFSDKGRVLRIATIDDLNQQSRLEDTKIDLMKAARAMVREMDLEMKIVEVEQLLGGERIIFHYTAEDWVDFRELVKRMAKQFHTRIEMHQVNAREEARLVADYEKCGQHCCCKQFLKVLKPVSMRSAKVQKATLDPTKISGRCGRLMCCLRYEDETYSSLKKRLPHRSTIVKTDDGEGVVVDSQILTQLVLVKLDETGKTAAYPLEHIEILRAGGQQPKKQKPEDDANAPAQDKSPRREQAPGGERQRSREPRRPRPGQPLEDHEIQSADTPDVQAANPLMPPTRLPDESAIQPVSSSGYSNQTPPSAAASNEQPAGEDQPRRKRKRRKRRKRRGSGDGGGGAGGGSADGGPSSS